MLPIEMIRTMYSAWANGCVLDAASKVENAAFVAPQPPADDSLAGLLSHVMSAEWIWLSRWGGIAPPQNMHAVYADAASLRDQWRRIQRHTETFLMELDEASLKRDVSYLNSAGEPWTYPVWQMMLHQANHATQHRSEAAVLLTALGQSPGQLDVLRYVDQFPPSKSQER